MRLGSTSLAEPGSSFRLLPVLGGAWGAGAYLIERRVARWFLATPARLQAPVDFLLFQQPIAVYPPGLNNLQMDPAPCVQDKYYPAIDQRLGFDSAIDGSISPRQRMARLAKQRLASTGRQLLGKRIVAYSGEAIPSA
jgi:GR25 family glycosyltransferase involved in LPS biosynthesis